MGDGLLLILKTVTFSTEYEDVSWTAYNVLLCVGRGEIKSNICERERHSIGSLGKVLDVTQVGRDRVVYALATNIIPGRLQNSMERNVRPGEHKSYEDRLFRLLIG